jgi:hypothetical protein
MLCILALAGLVSALHLLYFTIAITGFMMACATFLIKPTVRKY